VNHFAGRAALLRRLVKRVILMQAAQQRRPTFRFTRSLQANVASIGTMNLTLRHVVPALAGAIAIRKSCVATSKCCRLKAGLHAGRFMGRQ